MSHYTEGGDAPVVLSFLAPAKQCNQRCPACILDQVGEPVREASLTPSDYAKFVSQFAEKGIPIRSVAFQGYEVTLPSSWPYLAETFSVAQDRDIPRSFITNGMLLHKWTHAALDLDPQRISISLDGAEAETNDPLRGLRGAFQATISSVQLFLAGAPNLVSRVAVVSILYPGRNEDSLCRMPRLLRELGVSHWAVGWELRVDDGTAQATVDRRSLGNFLLPLRTEAERHGIAFHASDDFCVLQEPVRSAVNARSPEDPERFYRIDPLGYVRTLSEANSVWSPGSRRWNPSHDHAVEISGYVPGDGP